ncbi:MAG: NYN domain-containing protein [Patescibacteria group bacterium]|nr:NYN domain-containing protein [Patescibacteria group bacterium]
MRWKTIPFEPSLPRVGIFADVSNQYKAAKKAWGGKVDYREIMRCSAAGRQVVVANAYVVHDPEDDLQPNFFAALRYSKYRLREKNLRILKEGKREGNWDVGLAVDAVALGSQLDVVVLVTGDGDFISLVEHLKGKSCHIVVMSVELALSNWLRDAAHEVVLLDQPQFHYYDDKYIVEGENIVRMLDRSLYI